VASYLEFSYTQKYIHECFGVEAYVEVESSVIAKEVGFAVARHCPVNLSEEIS